MIWAIVWLAAGYALRHYQDAIVAWVKHKLNGVDDA